MQTIDFNNIIKHPLIKATEFSEVHGGSLVKPAPDSASVHSASSASSMSSHHSSHSLEPAYMPVVLKWSRHPADFRDMLFAFSKLREHSPNVVTFYGATREHPSATSSIPSTLSNSPIAGNSNHYSNGSRAGTLGMSSPPQDRVGSRDWIVTKPSAHGTLHEFLKLPQGVALDWMDKIRLIRGVANGLLFLHDHGVLHMNLHSDNVLVENGPTAVLTDFGQASRSIRKLETAETAEAHAGGSSPRYTQGGSVSEKILLYTAPERLANPELNPCTAASDVYSLGVLILEVMTGHRSLASQFLRSTTSDQQPLRLEGTIKGTRSGAPLPMLNTPHGTMTLPSAMESLIRRMCSRDPSQRPGMVAIRSQLKEMANKSFDLHVREPINRGTTGIQLSTKKPISLISVVTTPSHASEPGSTIGDSAASTRALIEPLKTPKSPNFPKRNTSILRAVLDMSLNAPPVSPKRKNIQIWEAVVKADIKSINTLLSQGISVNQRDPVTGFTPLLAAVADLEPNQTPSIPVMELLINRGAEINAFDFKTKQTLLHHLCARPNPSPAVLKFLLDRGANPNAISATRQTPLHYLAERARTSPLEPMRLLLDAGAEVDAKGPVMWTPLHLLCSSEKPFLDALMLLLTRDVDVNAKDSNQWTALHFVVHYNQDPVPALKILTDAGADVNALTKRREGVVQVLLKSKSIDRLAMDSINTMATPGPSGTGNNSPTSPGMSGLGIYSLTPSTHYGGGGHARKRSTASLVSPHGSINKLNALAEGEVTVDLSGNGQVLLTPEEEAKEESLKKLADIIRWLIVDCGERLEKSMDREDPFPPGHPKNQHVLFRAIRMGMRPIVQVLLETSLAMNDIQVLEDALQVTDEMQQLINLSMIPAASQWNDSASVGEPGTARSSMDTTVSSAGSSGSAAAALAAAHRRRTSSISSYSSLIFGTTASSSGQTTLSTLAPSTTPAGSNNVVTPKSLAAAAASLHRIQEIEALLKVWRFGEQRQQLLDSVEARLARSDRGRATRKEGRGGAPSPPHQGQVDGHHELLVGEEEASTGLNSPVSAASITAIEREMPLRSSTL